jgi:peptide/nickel transport system substrate-binding protein
MKNITKRFTVLLFCFILVAALTSCTTGGGDSNDSSDSSSGEAPAAEADESKDSGEAPATETGEGEDSGTDTDAGSAKNSLNVAVAQDSGTLDPVNITGYGGYLNVSLTYMEPLVDYHSDGTPEYLLAESIDEVSDIEFTVHLREGVKFSNGNPLTAEDVLFSMNREKEHPNRMLDVQFVDWEKTKIVDDLTIDLWFTQYTPMNFMKMSQLMIFDAESFDEEAASTNPIGTGPYVVKDYVVNSSVTVEANPGYWGKQPQIKTINFKCLNEQSQITNALEMGEVDYAAVPSNDAEYIESLGPYVIKTNYSGSAVTAFFNMSEDGLLATKDARDAISYAIDRQSMSDLAFNKYATIVTWPLATDLLDYEDKFADADPTYSTGYDPEKAKELAEKSGLAGKTIRIITNGAEYYVTMAEIMQASFAEIGVSAEIINYDQATYYETIMDPSNYEIAFYFTAAPSRLASDLFANYPTFFKLGWKDSEREAFVAQGQDALATPDEAQRAEKLAALVDTFYTYSPWYGICNMPDLSAISADIEGVEWWLGGGVHFQDWSFK